MTSPHSRWPKLNWMDVLWLVFLAGLAVLPPVAEVHKQLILLAIGVLQLVEVAHHCLATTARPQLRRAAQASPGHFAAQPHRRPGHQQQLLSHPVPAGRHRRTILRPLGHAALDRAGFGRILFVSTPGVAGLRPHAKRRHRPGLAQFVFLPRGHHRQSLRRGKSPPDAALPAPRRAASRNQSPARARPGRGAPFRAPCRSRPAFRGPGARDSQSARHHQRLRRDAQSAPCRRPSLWPRNWPATSPARSIASATSSPAFSISPARCASNSIPFPSPPSPTARSTPSPPIGTAPPCNVVRHYQENLPDIPVDEKVLRAGLRQSGPECL